MAVICPQVSSAGAQDNAALESCTEIGASQPEIVGTVAVTHDDYPLISLVTREEGRAVLDVDVTMEGAIVAARIAETTGSYRLDERSIEVVRERWRFSPAMLNGGPVSCTTQVAVRWDLTDEGSAAQEGQLSDELLQLLRDLRSR